MANLEETAVWTPGVYQLETTDPVLGGPVQPEPATGGIANRAALALANRTAYLKAQVELKANSDVPLASFNGPLPFARLSEVPTSFTASPHQHAWADVTDAPEPATRWPTWDEVTDKPASFGPQIVTLATLPATDIGPVIVADVAEVWVWVSTPYYTGYRSPLCGRPVDGHTIAPLVSEIDAVGGLLSKSAYAGLWGYAQENNLVVIQSYWSANVGAYYFVDVSDSQFRVPDLRNQFLRFTGTDVDGLSERALGSRQLDATQLVTGSLGRVLSGAINGPFVYVNHSAGGLKSGWEAGIGHTDFDNSRVARTSSETRPVNVAFHPRIHV